MERDQAEVVSQLRAVRARLVDEISMLKLNRSALAQGFEGPAARRTLGELSRVIAHLADADEELLAVQTAVAGVPPAPARSRP